MQSGESRTGNCDQVRLETRLPISRIPPLAGCPGCRCCSYGAVLRMDSQDRPTTKHRTFSPEVKVCENGPTQDPKAGKKDRTPAGLVTQTRATAFVYGLLTVDGAA